MACKVKVLGQLEADWVQKDGWRLFLQWCDYQHTDKPHEKGFRFIYKTPQGKLQTARGQARLPSLADAEALIAKMKATVWGQLTDGLEAERLPQEN
jgi:hypothetical protein